MNTERQKGIRELLLCHHIILAGAKRREAKQIAAQDSASFPAVSEEGRGRLHEKEEPADRPETAIDA